MSIVETALSLCIYTAVDNEVRGLLRCFDVIAVGREEGRGEGSDQSHARFQAILETWL